MGKSARGFPLPRLLGARQAGFRKAGLIAVAALALLTSCTAIKLSYNRLDWLVGWQVGKYVELDGESKRLFDSGFDSLWHWHRSTQLSVYAQDLREAARLAGGPVSAGEVRSVMARVREHGKRLFDEALPRTAPVLARLDDEQVRELMANLGERREEEIEEFADMTPDEAKDERAKVMARGIRKWFGSVTEDQRALARIWAGTRREDPELFRKYGDEWDRAFQRALATRHAPGFEQRLRAVFWEPALPHASALHAQNEHNREAWARFVEKLAASLSHEQRRYFQRRMHGLAEDLEELSGVPAAGAGTIG